MDIQTSMYLIGILLAVVGYFLKTFHAEYRMDRKESVVKERATEERIQRVADTFTTKLGEILDRIGDKINKLPTGSENLTQVMMQWERDLLGRDQGIFKRIDDTNQRIQNIHERIQSQHDRVETVAARVHEYLNDETAPQLRRQMEERKKKKHEDAQRDEQPKGSSS